MVWIGMDFWRPSSPTPMQWQRPSSARSGSSLSVLILFHLLSLFIYCCYNYCNYNTAGISSIITCWTHPSDQNPYIPEPSQFKRQVRAGRMGQQRERFPRCFGTGTDTLCQLALPRSRPMAAGERHRGPVIGGWGQGLFWPVVYSCSGSGEASEPCRQKSQHTQPSG